MAASLAIDYSSAFPSSLFDEEGCKYCHTKKTGYLTKSPRRRNFKLGRWRRRWFILVETIVSKPGKLPERYVWLEYFKMPGKHRWTSKQRPPVLKGMLDLRSCIAVVAIDKPIKGYEFNVITKTEVHYFRAESEEDRQDWITVLNDFLFPKDMFWYRSMRLNNSISVVNGTDNASRPSIPHSDSRWMASYEEPQKNECGLHIQLAGLGVRNVPRHQIKADAPVPSHGKFLCYKGRLTSSYKPKTCTYQVFLKTAKDDTGTTNILQEAAILAQLYHPNVVKLFGTVLVGYPKMTVMELCIKGNLRDRLHSLKTEIDDSGGRYYTVLLNYCRQITLGMHYLSERGFIHKSLMAKHILVTKDDNCKISGFADSVVLENNKTLLSEDSPAISKWTAPEALSDGNYTNASTVWSLSIVMYEIWSLGNEPYAGLTACTTLEVLKKINAGYRLAAPQGCPKAIYNLMESCWQREPLMRPSYNYLVKYLLKHENYLLDLELLTVDGRHSKSDTVLRRRNVHSATQEILHTAAQVQQHSYYNSPPSKLSSEPPSTDITPYQHQHDLLPTFLKSESVPAVCKEDESDEDDYTEVSTILEIRSKSATNLSNQCNWISLPSSTTMSGRWICFFDDSNNESGQEDSECESPYRNECKTYLVSTESSCSSTEKTQQQHTYTQGGTENFYHAVSPTAKARYLSSYRSENTPTFAAHNNPEDQQRERGKLGTECMLAGPVPSPPPFSYSGLQQSTERGKALSSDESSAKIATMKQKAIKPPVPTPRSQTKCHKLNSLPSYYNYNPHAQQNSLAAARNFHQSTPTIAVQGDTSPPPNEYETIKSYDPEIWHLFENKTDSQTSLNCHSDGYELIQGYETLTHTMTMEEYSHLAKPQVYSGYLSL